MTWQRSFNLWGALRYKVAIDGVVVGETAETSLQPAAPMLGGTRRWQVTAIDMRGQTRRSRTRLLRIDDVGPRLSVGYKRKKRVVSLTSEPRHRGPGQRASGVRSVVVRWGDRTQGARA